MKSHRRPLNLLPAEALHKTGDVDHLRHQIACRPRYGRHDGPSRADQRIEQRRLPDVRRRYEPVAPCHQRTTKRPRQFDRLERLSRLTGTEVQEPRRVNAAKHEPALAQVQ